MIVTQGCNFQEYSFAVVDMADCSVVQRFADVSRFRRVLVARAAMRSRPQCVGLNLAHYEERHHLVLNDHHVGRENLPGKGFHLLSRGEEMVELGLRRITRNWTCG